ncbi:MAG: twin-arginine translocation signal domain-containing protein [Bacteroidetes bacterium]|nr:MAG: twin-arginine translocation signal domain-containing protein [Bacteroidota bacterium]
MKNRNPLSRRNFIKTSAAATAGLTFALSAKSYGRILGANDRLNVAVVGMHGRGKALLRGIATVANSQVSYLCDVDSRVLEEAAGLAEKATGSRPKLEKDIRKILDDKEVDAIMIAAPDHWHAPMSLMALKAGKHVYVEKPCGHNPREGEMLVEAQLKYGRVVQMGNQQRSAPTSMEAVQMIRDGAIGTPYLGKAWYANTRGSIGIGKMAAIPEWLDFELWQGPAPRREYQDNLVHYNWHWFWHWGTGEICNNGTHEIDICRWALGVDYPNRVKSTGGRYHYRDDDWEFYDTQMAHFEFEGGKTIIWEGLSCNGLKYFDRGRGAIIQGTEGSILLDRNGYIHYDKGGKVIKEVKENRRSATTNTVGAGALDTYHIQNFADAIRAGAQQYSPIDEGHKSVLLCHLGNIAQKLGTELVTDTKTGRVMNHKQAKALWGREYEPGWEMVV